MSDTIKITELDSEKGAPVRIIAMNSGSTTDAEGTWQDFIEVRSSCLLTINASASARYGGPTVNAGIRLYVRLDGDLVASDMSFEGESSTITFYSSASTTIFLKKGRYDLKVDREDIRTNSNFQLNVNYFAVHAKKVNIIE